jgi:membrane-bound metal-dependent hydrolase YbcI (DUF457 family)
MMAPGHRAAAFTAAFTVAAIVDATPGSTAVTAVVAAMFSAGVASPDGDQREPLRSALGHRGATHWWGWPVAWAVTCWLAGLPLVAYGPAIAWGSHVAVDAVWGKGGRSIPRGVPVWPTRRGRRVGLGYRVTSDTVPGGHSVSEALGTLAFGATSVAWSLHLLLHLT